MARAKTSTTKNSSTTKKATAAATKRPYLKQSDVPSASLADALRIPKAIAENYGGKPTPPLQVAMALNVDPGGSQSRAAVPPHLEQAVLDAAAETPGQCIFVEHG